MGAKSSQLRQQGGAHDSPQRHVIQRADDGGIRNAHDSESTQKKDEEGICNANNSESTQIKDEEGRCNANNSESTQIKDDEEIRNTNNESARSSSEPIPDADKRATVSMNSVNKRSSSCERRVTFEDDVAPSPVAEAGWVQSSSSTFSTQAFEGKWITIHGCFALHCEDDSLYYTQEEESDTYRGILKGDGDIFQGKITSQENEERDVGTLKLWFKHTILYSSFQPVSTRETSDEVRCFKRPDLIGSWYSHEGMMQIEPSNGERVLEFTQWTEYRCATASLHPEIIDGLLVYVGYISFDDIGVASVCLRAERVTLLCSYIGQDGMKLERICTKCDELRPVYVSLASLKDDDGKSWFLWVSQEEFIAPSIPDKLQKLLDAHELATVSSSSFLPKQRSQRGRSDSLADQIRWLSKAMRAAATDGVNVCDVINEFYMDVACLLSMPFNSRLPPDSMGTSALSTSKQPATNKSLVERQLPNDADEFDASIVDDTWWDGSIPTFSEFQHTDRWEERLKLGEPGVLNTVRSKLMKNSQLFARRLSGANLTHNMSEMTRPGLSGREIMPPAWTEETKIQLQVLRAHVPAGCVAVQNLLPYYITMQVAVMIIHPRTKQILTQEKGILRNPLPGEDYVKLGMNWNDMLPYMTVELDKMSVDVAANLFIRDVLKLDATPTERVYRINFSPPPENVIQYVLEFILTDTEIPSDKVVTIAMQPHSEYKEKELCWMSEADWISNMNMMVVQSRILLLDMSILVPWYSANLPDNVSLSEKAIRALQTGQRRLFRKGHVDALFLGEDYVYLDIRTPKTQLRSSMGELPCLRLRPYETVRQCAARIVNALRITEPLRLSQTVRVKRTMGVSAKPTITLHTANHSVIAYCDLQFGTDVIFPGSDL